MTRRPHNPTAREIAWEVEAKLYGARFVGRPSPGFYALRLVRGGIEVAARITCGPSADPDTGELLDRSWHFAAEINGEPDRDPRPEPNERVWMVHERGRRIGEAEYRWLLDDRAWAARFRPSLPESRPNAPIDWLSVPTPKF